MADLDEIPWGELVLMLQARAQSYQREEDEVEEASAEQIFAFFGASSKK